MYGLPKDFDGCFFIGQTVEQIGFAEHQVHIWMVKYLASGDHSDNATITIKGSYSFYPFDSPQKKRTVDVRKPITESDLMKILDCQVTEVYGDDEGTLSLKFDSGYILECYECPQYESYSIEHGKKTITV